LVHGLELVVIEFRSDLHLHPFVRVDAVRSKLAPETGREPGQGLPREDPLGRFDVVAIQLMNVRQRGDDELPIPVPVCARVAGKEQLTQVNVVTKAVDR